MVGQARSGFRRLGSGPYPGDVFLSLPMAHRRTGLPSAPPPIDMEKDLKTAALYRQTVGARPRAPRLASRTPTRYVARCTRHSSPHAPAPLARTRHHPHPSPNPTPTPNPNPNPNPQPSTYAAELGAARRCPNLTSVDLAALLKRVWARTTTPADRRLAEVT